MNELLFVAITFTIIIAVGYLIIKGYNAKLVFLFSGVITLGLYTLLTGHSVLGDDTVGNKLIDIFLVFGDKFRSNVSGVGTVIMVVTGYSAYMNHLKASDKLAYLAVKPLSKIKNKYFVISGVFVVAIFLKAIITSQAGLTMLLLATVWPILMALNVSKLTAASVLGLIALDYGPNDGSTIFAAEVAELSVVDFVFDYQIYVVLIIVLVLAIIIPIYYRMMDQRDLKKGKTLDYDQREIVNPDVPSFYSLLPILPLAIVLFTSLLPIETIDVVTANFIGILFTFLVTLLRNRNLKNLSNDFDAIFKGMGTAFSNIVSLIIAASVFAEGINKLGGIAIIANKLAELQGAASLTVLFMGLITFIAAAIMGSGAASWFAFGPLIPGIAATLGVSVIPFVLTMELGASLGRAMSPVAGAEIAIAGHAEQNVFHIVKRNAPILIVAFLVTFISSVILFMN